MRTFTALQLQGRVQKLVDLENDPHVAAAEIKERLSASYGKYYAKLVKAGMGLAGETTQAIAMDGVAQTAALPADHFATLRVDYAIDSSRWEPLDELDVREIHLLPNSGSWACGYRLVGQTITFYPLPAAGTYRHVYVPAAADLTTDGQTVDGVSGWERALVVDAAIECLLKQGRDQTVLQTLLRERDIIDARIDEEASMRSLTQHRRIIPRSRLRRGYDTDGRRGFDPGDWPPWIWS
jgi:hypothetical protein